MKNIRKAIWAFSNGIVTFTAPKPAHVFLNLTSDPIVVSQIGSPREAVQSKLKLEVITKNDLYTLRVPRPWDSHKGLFGHVLVVGASPAKPAPPPLPAAPPLRPCAALAHP